MDTDFLNKELKTIIQPDIECRVTFNKSINKKTVSINFNKFYQTLSMIGNLEEGIFAIGNEFSKFSSDEAFIRVFNEKNQIVCNQNFKVSVIGGLRENLKNTSKSDYDFLINILPDKENNATGFYYSIMEKENHLALAQGTVLETSCDKSIDKVSKEILMRICYKLIKGHFLKIDNYNVLQLKVHTHCLNYSSEKWNIIVDPFTVRSRT